MKLLILAAGLGSRFGGLKQLAAVGPSGESLPEYNIYDAMCAGFSGIVLLIRRGMEDELSAALLSRLPKDIAIELAYQDSEAFVPEHLKAFMAKAGRRKPWGTAHALLCARERLQDGPFAVMNGDDFYGRKGLAAVQAHLSSRYYGSSGEAIECCLAGYSLWGVLPPSGQVSRAACAVDSLGYLREIKEHKAVERRGNLCIATEPGGEELLLDSGVPISMNLWGLGPELFDWLEEHFKEFVSDPEHWASGEFYLPEAMGRIMRSGRAKYRVLPVQEEYFGLTNPDDLAQARAAARERHGRGEYPTPLWSSGSGRVI